MLVTREQRPARLPDTFIQEVKARTDIVSVIGPVVALKKSGSNLFGLCPFHGEKSPSFSVTPAKQFFKCFGCGAQGDAVDFLVRHSGLTLREAVEELAEKAGIALPAQNEAARREAQARAERAASIIQANETAGAFFRHCLVHDDKAKAYLKGRRVPVDLANTYLVGYAPPGWQSLREAFPDYETNTDLLAGGLVIESQPEGDKPKRRYDRFRDRLMFGIRDSRGRLVGFGGRELDGSEVKYINSPESAAFDKGQILFGVWEAREAIRTTGRVIVTEGYMDTIAHAAAGLRETVGTMGTSCTAAHVERLMSMAKEVIYAFDGDAAGMRAAWRALEASLAQADDQHTFRFLLLPGGLDPDELIGQEGAAVYRERVGRALPLSAFLVQQLAQRHNGLVSAEDRAAFVRDGLDLIAKLPYGIKLYRFLRAEIQAASGMDAATIEHMVAQRVETTAAPAANRTWTLLAQAVRDQPATANQFAEAAIEQLSPQQQDAFFAANWASLPEEELPFWQALQEVVRSGGDDQPTELASAQRDMLAGVVRLIRMEHAKRERKLMLAKVRTGELGVSDAVRTRLQGATP